MRKLIPLAAITVGLASPALASTTLTFEGIPESTSVGTYYAPDYVFSPASLARVDADAGGLGNFANEPSASTIMYFLDANNAILDATNGFITGFSFWYSSSTAASVTVYDALGGTGNILATLNLLAQYNDNGCTGDPNGQYCNWSPIGINFAGTAYSIDFGGTAGRTGFDNITFGSDVPNAVPEPGTWAMMLLGFGAIGFAMRRRMVPRRRQFV